MKELKPWELLEKYKPIVITEKDTYIDKDREYRVSAKWKKEASKYKYKKWKENIVLWATPEDVIPIEFEGIRNENAEWINATEKKCIKKGIDYCIVDHLGKSPYLYLFNPPQRVYYSRSLQNVVINDANALLATIQDWSKSSD